MNPFLDKIPPIKDLWKNEKEKYRLWMILFSLISLFIVTLFFASVIASFIDRDDIQSFYLKNTKDVDASQAHSMWLLNYMIMPGIQEVALILAIVLWVMTLLKSYKNQNFARLSSYSIVLFELSGFVAFIQFFMMIFSKSRPNFNNWVSILVFASQFVMIVGVYFSFKVAGIKRQFQISERVQQLKKDPNFQNMMQQSNNMYGMNNPFFGAAPNQQTNNRGPNNQQMHAAGATPNATTSNNTQSQNINTQQMSERDKAIAKLESLNLEQLKNMAKRLLISGAEKMNREELLIILKRLTINDNN